jgi:hypothetical protein
MLHGTLAMTFWGLEHIGYVDCQHVAVWRHQRPPFSQFDNTLKGSRVLGVDIWLFGNINGLPSCSSLTP